MPSFRLPDEQAVRVDADTLRAKAAALLQGAGLTAEDAAQAADVLVSADLRGVDTHGVSNMLVRYLDLLRNGTIHARPAWHITRETPASANIDSDRGLGVVLAPRAMQIAIAKARTVGVGFVTMHNGYHLGMAQYHALLAVPHDMIGLCLTATGPIMLPTFGREPRLGTNPIAIAVPCAEELPFVYDAATTVVAANKLETARRMGALLPPGILAEEDGTPTMEPIPVPAGSWRMLPLGSTPELASHKGYGLACAVEILTNVLGGLTFSARLPRNYHNHCVAALDVAAFSDPGEFKRAMDDFVRMLKATPPAVGHERVLVPGQLEWETERERRANGIPLHPDVAAWLDRASTEIGI